MGTEEPGYAEILIELKGLIAEMKSGTGLYQGRPTESITKSSLETMKLIQAQEKECARACKDRLQAKIDPVANDIHRLEEGLKDLKTRIFAEVGDIDTASKTRNGHVATLADHVDRLMRTLYLGEDGQLDDRVAYVEAWVDERIAQEAEEKVSSRFTISTILAIVGILSALGLGIAGLIIQVVKMG
jgi:hypothetical protein